MTIGIIYNLEEATLYVTVLVGYQLVFLLAFGSTRSDSVVTWF